MSPGDKPEDKIIQDDIALDRWFRQYIREAQRRSASRDPNKGMKFSENS